MGVGDVCGCGENMVIYFLLYVGMLTNENLKGKLTKGKKRRCSKGKIEKNRLNQEDMFY